MLTRDGDMHEEIRDTWLAAHVVTDRRHFPIGPANVVALTDPREDTEMLQHITEGRFERVGAVLPSLSQSMLGLSPISTGAVN